MKKGDNQTKPRIPVCALDPGVRKFQTVYSDTKIEKIQVDKEKIKKLHIKLDLFASLRAKKIIGKNRYTRRVKKIYNRIDNLIDDLHYKTIKSITDDYQLIFLPSFESQEMVRRNKFGNRNLLGLKHYLFQTRLKNKCFMMKHSNVHICTEEYTSKTCTNCGCLNDFLGMSEIFECSKCNIKIDRDVNGSRNILIKCLSS